MLNLIRLKNYPILHQLQLEEALLRADSRNWCILNEGSPEAIVMGISGRVHELINQKVYVKAPVPVIKRFSGGGTVFVDHNTCFVTMICNHASTSVAPFPDQVLRWNAALYHDFLKDHGFIIQANDYALNDRKFGGNAQYLSKGRWLHHSSLLWDFNPKNMEVLKMPPKIPDYRKARPHSDFLCTLKDCLDSPEALFNKILHQLTQFFQIKEVKLNEVDDIMHLPHRRSTEEITF